MNHFINCNKYLTLPVFYAFPSDRHRLMFNLPIITSANAVAVASFPIVDGIDEATRSPLNQPQIYVQI